MLDGEFESRETKSASSVICEWMTVISAPTLRRGNCTLYRGIGLNYMYYSAAKIRSGEPNSHIT